MLDIQYEAILTEEELKNTCIENLENGFHPPATMIMLAAGIHWGNKTSGTKTSLVIGYHDLHDKDFKICFIGLFSECGFELINKIIETLNKFSVKDIYVDWGSGFIQNQVLSSKLSFPLNEVMYTKSDVLIKEVCGLIKLSRTKSLNETFKDIKNKDIKFFNWGQLKEFSSDLLSNYINEKTDSEGKIYITYDHKEDDSILQALNIVYNVSYNN